MRKLTLHSIVLLVGLLLISQSSWAQAYKFKSSPRLPIGNAQTVIDKIFVPTNVKVTDIRIGLYAKVIKYSTLRIELTTPLGSKIRLKTEAASSVNWYGSFGSPRSYTIFQDGGATQPLPDPATTPTQPNDRPVAPVTPFATVNNETSFGNWTLTITDYSNLVTPYQEGFLENWVLMFNAVTVEPEAVVWSQTKTGGTLIGQLNGQVQIVPNKRNAAAMCFTPSGNANNVVGENGDAFPFIISNTGYPGLRVGDPVPGYVTPGRFKITVSIATNNPPPSPTGAAYTEDIAIYFGKSANYTPPLQNPPVPAKTVGTAAPWPTGSGNTTNTLLPISGSPTYGGVRLVSCNNSSIWGLLPSDIGGYIDASFDDRALTSINTAQPCLGVGDGICGSYKPQQNLSLLNGLPVEGLYYVTIFDTWGENFTQFGHVRVLSLRVEYLAGGGQTANPFLGQGIAGPLLGVPIPGRITGAPIGYLPDIISTVPPYSIHAKDQDPLLLFWATQKMYPRSAVGFERVQAIVPPNTVPSGGVLYNGPYAYPSSLDANPAVAGVLVNADLMTIPSGDYKFRLNLVQARDYDDDVTDNEIESPFVKVSPTTMAYYGNPLLQYNNFQSGNQAGQVAAMPLGAFNTAYSGTGVAFTVFKNPSTTVTSIDYKFDDALTAYVTNYRSNMRISIWRCANGFFGAPVGPPVARSMNIASNEYMPGNWRSFPIYRCDATGTPTDPTVSLAPGTYIVTLDNVGTGTPYVFAYTYGILPHLDDRYRDYLFSEKFGPLGPFSTLGTRFLYQYTVSALNPPPTGVWSQIYTPTTTNFGNYTLPIRMNMTSQNDFAIDYILINGTKGPETMSMTSAPFQPNVFVTANSLQNNQTKDFNVRLEIFDGPTRVYISDKMYAAGINGYQSVSVPMDQWNPPTGGIYRMRATFSRNPDDQNPANDSHEYYLYVSSTRAILALGNGASSADISSAIISLKDKGIEVEVLNSNDTKISKSKAGNIYILGSLDSDAKNNIAKAVENGSDVAFVYNKTDKPGKVAQSIDEFFNIDRGPSVDYSKIGVMPTEVVNQPVSEPVLPDNLTITSKEDLIAFLNSTPRTVEPVQISRPAVSTNAEEFSPILPVAVSSPYGDIRYRAEESGSLGFVFAIPSTRKSGEVKVDLATPAGYELEQNYPNPFNPSTVISYSIPDQSLVTLRVLDMLGREVATLISTTQDAGKYSISWKGQDNLGKDVASGSYFYRLDAVPVNGGNPFTNVKKMTLSK